MPVIFPRSCWVALVNCCCTAGASSMATNKRILYVVILAPIPAQSPVNVLYWRGMRQRTKRFFFIAGAIALGASQLWPLAPVLAQTQFNYDYIMADRDLTDYESMSLAQIQAFLESKYSPLANYVEPITSLRAAQIIYSTAQDFQISPKFLLALMQKEQSFLVLRY